MSNIGQSGLLFDKAFIVFGRITDNVCLMRLADAFELGDNFGGSKTLRLVSLA